MVVMSLTGLRRFQSRQISGVGDLLKSIRQIVKKAGLRRVAFLLSGVLQLAGDIRKLLLELGRILGFELPQLLKELRGFGDLRAVLAGDTGLARR